MTEKKLNDTYKTNYHFITKGKRTSFILDKLKDNFNEFEYKYDALDNITDIYKNGDLINHYEYDNSNQLIKDDDYERNVTTVYSYDNVGNIVSKKEYVLNTETLLNQDTYLYSNSNWEDQLTKFNNENITYDEIGNPLSIGNKTLTWTNGRQLESIIDDTNTITYEYNKDGIRTKKTVNGQDTTYLLENNNIIFEESPKGMIYYKRDENNHLVGFRHNYKHYFYLKNAQEDIIGIMDSNYNVIANYKYDAYGKIVSVKDNNGNNITDTNHIAYINPFRYRSYYYDEETKLYYLNSRYYNPLLGRFINADRLLGPGNDFAYNLYLYCGNNPVSRVDEDGNWFLGIVAKGIKAVAKPALKAADKMVKGVGNCIGAVFGAGASTTVKQDYKSPIFNKAGVSMITGSSINIPISSVGDSNKPISGYYSQANNDANIGINLNLGYFKETVNIGLDDISVSYGIYSNREKTRFHELKLGASIKQFTFFAQGNYNLANKDGSSIDTYVRADVNALIPIAVFAGGPIVRTIAGALQGGGIFAPAY